MPQEIGYRQQVGPAAPSNLPDANPGAFGAGVGAGIAEVGGALHVSEQRAYQVERQRTADTEAADFSAKFARIREAADQASIDARNNAQPGGAGHADAIGKWYDGQTATLLDGITDDRVRRSAQTQLQEFGGRLRSNEYQWQEGARVGKIVTDQRDLTQIAQNRAYRSHDPSAFAEELKIGRTAIESLAGVPADVKDKLIREHDESVTFGFFNGVLDTKPQSIKPLLDSGQFDDMLTPQQMEHLRNGAEIEMRRAEAVQKAEAAHQVTLQKEQLATARAQLDTGAGKPQDWEALATQYEAIGDTSSAVTARAKGTAMKAAMVHRGDAPAQLDERIGTLQAKQGRLSPTEASELSGLVDLRGQMQGRLGQPGGALMQYAFATGTTVPAVDLADPASMRRRGQMAITAASQYGRGSVEPLTPNELPTFKDLIAKGSQGKVEALRLVRQLGDPRAIAGAARQISGDGQGDIRIAATVGDEVARDIIRGGDVTPGAHAWSEPKAAADYGKWYGRLLAQVPNGYREDVFKAAKNFYLARMSDNGGGTYNPGLFAQAVETVLGRVGQKGGTTRDPAGRLILVPAGMSGQDLLRSFARASNEDYARAAGGRRPVWNGNQPVTREQFSRLMPYAVGGGRYAFVAPGGKLIADDKGGTYTVDANRLTNR